MVARFEEGKLGAEQRQLSSNHSCLSPGEHRNHKKAHRQLSPSMGLLETPADESHLNVSPTYPEC